jgi:PAS domain S-box-containing protein
MHLDTAPLPPDDRAMSSAGQERRIGQILDGFGDGFVAFDQDWRVTYCNRAAEVHSGLAREEVLGRIYWEVAPGLVGTPLEAAFHRAMAERVTVKVEIPSVFRPGAFLALRAFPIDGGVAISFSDITERRQREQRERKQAQRLELALTASGLGDWSWDPASDLVTLSSRAAAIFDMPPGALMTWNEILAWVHPEDTGALRDAVDGALSGRTGYEIEYRITPPGRDAEIWVMSRAHAEIAEDGTTLSLQGVVGDITRRKAQEAELRESEARFRAMANSAPAPVWVTSTEGRVEFVNQAFAEYVGKPAEELIGAGIWREVWHPDDIAGVMQARRTAAEGAQPWSVEGRFRHASGEWRWMRTAARPRFDAAGRFEGYVGMAIDMSEVHAAEERQQLLINELNHRVKNTLATVQSIARQTLRDGVPSDVGRAHFTERLLALSTVHNVLTRENWESVELGDIAAEAVRPYDEAQAPRIHIEGPAARLAPTTALALSMAFHELATNATKYGALSVAGGRVKLSWSSRSEGLVHIVWRETGGPPVTPPAAKGFGSRLLGQGLAAEIGRPAVLVYDAAGLICTVTAPLADS